MSSSEGGPKGVSTRSGSTPRMPGRSYRPLPPIMPNLRSATLPPDDAHHRTRVDGEPRGGIHDVAVDHVEGRLPKLNAEARHDLVADVPQPGRTAASDRRHAAEELRCTDLAGE